MASLPSDDEIRRVGMDLGHGPGPYETKVRAQIVKTIQLSDRLTPTPAAKADAAAFAVKIGTLYSELRSSTPLGVEGVERVVAALAPTIYREPTPTEKNRNTAP